MDVLSPDTELSVFCPEPRRSLDLKFHLMCPAHALHTPIPANLVVLGDRTDFCLCPLTRMRLKLIIRFPGTQLLVLLCRPLVMLSVWWPGCEDEMVYATSHCVWKMVTSVDPNPLVPALREFALRVFDCSRVLFAKHYHLNLLLTFWATIFCVGRPPTKTNTKECFLS